MIKREEGKDGKGKGREGRKDTRGRERDGRREIECAGRLLVTSNLT